MGLGWNIAYKDAAFCLCCYLFANVRENQSGDFIGMGFSTWNKLDSFDNHVGDFNSVHSKALRYYKNLRKPRQSIEVALDRHGEETRKKYRLRLNSSILAQDICCVKVYFSRS